MMESVFEYWLIFLILWTFYKIFIRVIMGIDDDEE